VLPALAAVGLVLLPEGLRTMALFFLGAALVTFGGAYAVLPYVQAGGVAHGWITGPQMLDGLALGETTPGPLILVVTFVGFLGAGVAGAVVATVATFLPSYVFVIGGAPFVERMRSVPAFAAPLAGVSCAVVGVILALAVTLGRQVLVDPTAWALAAVALLAMVRFDQTVPRVVLGATALGLARAAISA
jgi:chromate transporter